MLSRTAITTYQHCPATAGTAADPLSRGSRAAGRERAGASVDESKHIGRLTAFLACGLCACLLAGCRPGPDVRDAMTFQRAQETFDQAQSRDDFLRAAALYQEILDGGVTSGAVLYNQGNAFMQAKQPGRAIAAYRQAQRYRPRDPYLEANLRFAVQSGTAARRPLFEYLLFWQNWLSYPEKFWGLGFLALAAFLLGLGGLLARRRILSWLALGGVVLTLLMGVSAGYDWYRYAWLVHGVVVQADTVARKGDAASYEPALSGSLDERTEFLLLQSRGDWLLIQLPGGQEGWIERSRAVLY